MVFAYILGFLPFCQNLELRTQPYRKTLAKVAALLVRLVDWSVSTRIKPRPQQQNNHLSPSSFYSWMKREKGGISTKKYYKRKIYQNGAGTEALTFP